MVSPVIAVRVKDGAFSPTWNNPAETGVIHSIGKTSSPNTSANRLITASSLTNTDDLTNSTLILDRHNRYSRSNDQLLDTASYHGVFWSGNRRGEEKLIFDKALTLIQHILELSLGSPLKSNELEPESITILPTDDSEGDDDRRPRLWSLYTEAQAGPDGELDMAFDFTSGNREISHRSLP